MSNDDCPMGKHLGHHNPPRRSFLKTMAAGGVAAFGARALRGSEGAVTSSPEKALPTIRLGDKLVSRLIVGSNPIHGYSHSTMKLSRHMRQHFTVERTTEFLLHCESQGITTFQGSYSTTVRDALRAAWEKGSKMQWICLTSDKHRNLDDVLPLKPIAVFHHGSVTDTLFRGGKQGNIHDFVKKVHDAGVPAGISMHNPDNLAWIEDAGWESEFYMNCFYHVTRSSEEIKVLLGQEPLGELFLESDPKAMTACMRQVKKPCLGFKILGAGRLCWNAPSIERAFKFAYSEVKPTDALIVGMYPVFSDEVREDADLARTYANPN